MTDDLSRILGWNPSEVIMEMRGFGSSVKYFHDHYQELCEKFPDEYMLIVDGELRGHNPQLRALLDSIQDESALRRGYIQRTYVKDKPTIIVMPGSTARN